MYSLVCVFFGVFVVPYSLNEFSSRNRITLPDFRVLIRSFPGGMLRYLIIYNQT